jgi:hypothetical protein
VRLESSGIDFLGERRRLGVDIVVQSVHVGAGNSAWANRRSALMQALHLADREGRGSAAGRLLSPCVQT